METLYRYGFHSRRAMVTTLAELSCYKRVRSTNWEVNRLSRNPSKPGITPGELGTMMV